MSNIESAKIIAFPQGKASPSKSSDQSASVNGRVYSLASSCGLKIFWERDTKPYSSAQEFFKTLFAIGHITILCENGDVQKNSILNVQDTDGTEYEISVGEFVRLTRASPATEISEYNEYIIGNLAQLGISIGMKADDISTTETTLTEDEVEGYKPDGINALLDTGEFYVCEAYYTKDAPVGYGEPTQFDTKKYTISLLDIILSSLDDASINGFDTRGISLDITYFENDATIVTSIEPLIVAKILHEALKRKNFLYRNMPLDKSIEHYFQHEVMKKLYETEDFETE